VLGRGIGDRHRQADGEAGALVALVDADAGLTAPARDIGLEGGEALPFDDDVTDSSPSSGCSTRWSTSGAGSTSLVNNAGIVTEAPLVDMTTDVDPDLEVNLRGVMSATRLRSPHAREGMGTDPLRDLLGRLTGAPGTTAYAARQAPASSA